MWRDAPPPPSCPLVSLVVKLFSVPSVVKSCRCRGLLQSAIYLLPCLSACDRHHTNFVHFSARLSHPISTLAPRPASAARTAQAIAIAITQSSCAPDAAPVVPSAPRTNVRHSFHSRALRNNSGVSASTAAIFSIISGRLDADVFH